MTPKPSDLLSVPSGYSVRMMKHLDFYAFDFVAWLQAVLGLLVGVSEDDHPDDMWNNKLFLNFTSFQRSLSGWQTT